MKRKKKNKTNDKQKKTNEITEGTDDGEEKEEMVFVQNTKKKTPECFLYRGEHYITSCPYRKQFKRARLNEGQNPEPPNTSSNILIQGTNDRDGHSTEEDNDTDLYDFSFINSSTQVITKTQKLHYHKNIRVIWSTAIGYF